MFDGSDPVVEVFGPGPSSTYGERLWPLADITSDGHPDLLVYTFFGRVLLDGTNLQELHFLPGNALCAPLGDLDRDGFGDHFWITATGSMPSVFLGNDVTQPAFPLGPSGLPDPPWLPDPLPPFYDWEHGGYSDAVPLGDWTGDGVGDFAVAYGNSTQLDPTLPTDNRIEFHSGADGSWFGGVRAGADSGLGDVVEAVPNANGDGQTLLAIGRGSRVRLLHEPSLATFRTLDRVRGHPDQNPFTLQSFGRGLACVGDVNGNGSPELAVLGRDNGVLTGGQECSVVVLVDTATGEALWELSCCDYPGTPSPGLVQQIDVNTMVEVGGDGTGDGIPDLLVGTWSHALLVSCAPAGFEIVGRQDGARAIGVTNPVEQSRDTVSVQTPVEDQDGLAVLLVGQQRSTTSFAGWSCLLTPDVRLGEMRRARLHSYAAVDLDLKTAPVGASVFTQWLVGEPTAGGGLSWSASAIAKLTVLP